MPGYRIYQINPLLQGDREQHQLILSLTRLHIAVRFILLLRQLWVDGNAGKPTSYSYIGKVLL